MTGVMRPCHHNFVYACTLDAVMASGRCPDGLFKFYYGHV